MINYRSDGEKKRAKSGLNLVLPVLAQKEGRNVKKKVLAFG
jgi:hypothetical protein